MMSKPKTDLFLPGQPPIDAYGNGGFRFSDMSHKGSLLLTPKGVYAWPVAHYADLSIADFMEVFVQKDDIDFIILGAGSEIQPKIDTISKKFQKEKIGLDVMNTGAAVRTYNVLLEEKRAFAAALIAVENP